MHAPQVLNYHTNLDSMSSIHYNLATPCSTVCVIAKGSSQNYIPSSVGCTATATQTTQHFTQLSSSVEYAGAVVKGWSHLLVVVVSSR